MPSRNHPESLIHDVDLCSLPFRARLIFHLLYIVAERDYYRFPIGPTPQKPLRLRSMIMALCPKYSDADLALDLQRLVDARVIHLRDSDRGWYGVIAERLWYRREDHTPGLPHYGPRGTPMAVPEPEPELMLGPLGALPAAKLKPSKLKPPDSESRSRAHESGAQALPVLIAPREESGNRDAVADEERFARSPEEVNKTALGRRLTRFLGLKQTMEECRRSGARWLQLIAERGEELTDLLETGERLAASGSELKDGLAKAKFLTARLKDRAA